MVLAKPENQHVLQAFSVAGKVAAVTGGARGIGLEVSRGLAEAGAEVALIYSSSAYDADAIAASISADANGVKCRAYRSDVTDANGIAATLQEIERDFGHLDIVVANAGIVSYHNAEDYTPDQFSEIMRVNLDGAFYTAQGAARIFKKQGRGNIIFTASVSATLVNVPQKQAAYNASKAALVHLAKSLAVEWVDFCRVNCISPGFISTDMIATQPAEWNQKWYSMIPGNRFCDAYELKGAYVFCASDASSYMTGANLIIDGGYTLP
ncbi:oxidoreductase-6 [Coleophoma crateriformis]|uniref:Oxidoreductase-6 n=1 Tax=Coleophoma crateriformis TaxID=565419 RepID=A0A3D8S3V0_9HELO|nr:oxidoreductase-6 [Coleophoma crateriformis]